MSPTKRKLFESDNAGSILIRLYFKLFVNVILQNETNARLNINRPENSVSLVHSYSLMFM